MKKKRVFLILFSIVFVFLLLIILEFEGIMPNITESKGLIDLNSGECRYQRYVFSLKVKDKITATPFSEEVRRLGIEIPNERIWKYMSGRYFRLSAHVISDGYYSVNAKFSKLLLIFEMYNIPDNERIAAIEEVLDCWKKVEPYEVDKTLRDIINKYEIKYNK